MAAEQLTSQELAAKLLVAFQEWPLYRQLQYASANINICAPPELRLFCGHAKCGFKTAWRLLASQQNFLATERGFQKPKSDKDFFEAKYRCRNCGVRATRYFYHWSQKGNEGSFYKVGQHPELEEHIPKTLEEKLSPDDLKVYKNSLRMRNFNYGIAAVAYMRRVVENRMNDMLDILYEAAHAHGGAMEILARHEEMMMEKRFSKKIEYAGDLR